MGKCPRCSYDLKTYKGNLICHKCGYTCSASEYNRTWTEYMQAVHDLDEKLLVDLRNLDTRSQDDKSSSST